MKRILLLAILGFQLFFNKAIAQDSLSSAVLNALTFRNIGPATTSGRIIDLAVHPTQRSTWFVATAGGGIWKTENAGTTFQPIFDQYGTQSIGCIELDPQNPNTIWVGTGENNNQRSVSYGNGLYVSRDGGKSFSLAGLKNSEHIGMVKVDPRNSNVVYVAAYGPLWKEGGDRGLYKTEDGGKTWARIQFVSENTGCNEVILDPSNPDIIYAAFHQRRRRQWTYLGGGPESAVYKSMDAGKTWKKIHNGLPAGDLGRFSLAVSPANPNKIYAIVEANEGKGGIYVSEDKGESWSKKNATFTAGNYYQEIFADPIDADRLFIADTWLKWSKDGGVTVSGVGEKWKHVDNHVVWVDETNTKHWLVGCDGGLYETFDNGAEWRFMDNLPVTQFYRVSVDNAEPFYNVYGGTQDNNTLGGPSRNASANGIPNSDWFITVGGDGFKSQIDPTNPDIVYSQWQYGGLIRYDRKTGEQVDIKPITGTDEVPLRWNWDAPLIVSQHNHKRLYFAANKVFRSDDQGNSWQPISGDLSRGIDRNKLPVMGRVWSMDAVAKNQSVSIYGNITYLSESPLDENFLVVGTDDGLIQITTDGGKTWSKQNKFPGVPDMTLVTCVFASQHNKNVIYATFDNHRSGDFKPYILKSTDAGKTWFGISNNLPANGSVKTINEDFVSEDLLFIGTEFGLYVSNNGGKKWTQWNSGLPPVPIKDIVIQKRENDLVLATFGRGFMVLDNYAPLRSANKENLQKEAFVFPIKNAKMYVPRAPIGGRGKAFKGGAYYNAPNPEQGAQIWFHLRDEYPTIKEKRQAMEKEQAALGKGNYYPSKDSIRLEALEEAPYLILVIKDNSGKEIRRLKTAAKRGMQCVNWDLRYASTNPLTFPEPDLSNPYAGPDDGPFVAPGTYQVSLLLVRNGKQTALGNAATVSCDYLYKPTIEGLEGEQRTAIVEGFSELRRQVSAANLYMQEIRSNFSSIRKSISYAGMDAEFTSELSVVANTWNQLNTQLNGDQIIAGHEFETSPGIYSQIETAVNGMVSTTTGPTQTHINAYKDAKSAFDKWVIAAREFDLAYMKLLSELDAKKIPYTPGRKFFLD